MHLEYFTPPTLNLCVGGVGREEGRGGLWFHVREHDYNG
jgi:hypothetical protein